MGPGMPNSGRSVIQTLPEELPRTVSAVFPPEQDQRRDRMWKRERERARNGLITARLRAACDQFSA